ncbi:uncharacterized protein LOC144340321 [Macaca mulatta]
MPFRKMFHLYSKQKALRQDRSQLGLGGPGTGLGSRIRPPSRGRARPQESPGFGHCRPGTVTRPAEHPRPARRDPAGSLRGRDSALASLAPHLFHTSPRGPTPRLPRRTLTAGASPGGGRPRSADYRATHNQQGEAAPKRGAQLNRQPAPRRARSCAGPTAQTRGRGARPPPPPRPAPSPTAQSCKGAPCYLRQGGGGGGRGSWLWSPVGPRVDTNHPCLPVRLWPLHPIFWGPGFSHTIETGPETGQKARLPPSDATAEANEPGTEVERPHRCCT